MNEKKQISDIEMDFVVFCIENIASRLDKKGSEIYELLTLKNDIIEDYIVENFEILHTQGKTYIIEEIIEYMKECEVLL